MFTNEIISKKLIVTFLKCINLIYLTIVPYKIYINEFAKPCLLPFVVLT